MELDSARCVLLRYSYQRFFSHASQLIDYQLHLADMRSLKGKFETQFVQVHCFACVPTCVLLLCNPRLRDEESLYVVPPRCLDDYYWMLASVSNQTVAREHEDLRVSIHDDGRFPGLRPMLVTNDQMRDHKLELLEPREFRRWCSCHIVNYNISQYDESEWEDRAIEFLPADFFSREIQGNPHQNGKDIVWHFPVTEWEEPSRFCMYVKR